MIHQTSPRITGVPRSLRLAWLVWLGMVLPTQAALGEESGPAVMTVHPDAGVGRAAKPRSARGAEGNSATADDARPARPVAAAAHKAPRDRFAERLLRRKQRTGPDPRLADLAATRGRVADVADLHGVAPIEPAGPMAAAAEHRIRIQTPIKPSEAARKAVAPAAPTVTALDEGIVKEITQRKVLFRLCYESARRRGVLATRADVKWIVAADGSVHDVEVVVDQDAQLSNCIRVVASRPFAGRVGQDLPVSVPLLFVSTR